ncbi:unnamed protein product [Pleuronectes platessa]|uniref:Uncharacterized protein n=1 Tax=Pleuronectes platessa TaxID=8262 RepID=A0A9N7VIW4_PLEPL|nr:unnamed protein product [Pleuronectes platessa]
MGRGGALRVEVRGVQQEQGGERRNKEGEGQRRREGRQQDMKGYRLNRDKEFAKEDGKEEEKEKNKTEKRESGGCHGYARGEIPEWSRPLRSVLGRWTMQHLGLLQCGLKKNRYLIETRWGSHQNGGW